MKKIILLSIMLVFALSMPVFSGSPDPNPTATATATATGGDATASATGGAGGNSNVTNNNSNTIQKGAIDNRNTNTNLNTNLNSNTNNNTNVGVNTQGQLQGQQQGQFQGQNNNQVISPSQEINITSPDKILNGSAPNTIGGNELNFISPNEKDVQTLLPKFAVGTILPVKDSDIIVDVIYVKADIKFKNLYKNVLKAMRSKDVLQSFGTLRYQIRESASTKTWTTGGSISGNGLAANGGALTGATGSLIPNIGRSKSSNLYTIVIVEVQQFK